MPVGTDIGVVHPEQQGKGLSQFLGEGPSALEVALMAMNKKAKTLAAAKKERDAVLSELSDLVPDEVWHHYSSKAVEEGNKLVDEGSDLMTLHGIPNVFKSPHPLARQWQKKIRGFQAGVKNIEQYKEQWTAASGAFKVRGNKYSPEYVDKANNFPKNFTYEELKSGQPTFPPSDFADTFSLQKDFLKNWGEEAMKNTDPSFSADHGWAAGQWGAFLNSSQDPLPYIKQARGNYENLTDSAKEYYNGLADDLGLELDQGYVALVADNAVAKWGGKDTYSVGDLVIEMADKIPISSIERIKEVEDITKLTYKESYSGDTARLLAAGLVAQRAALYMKPENYQTQLGISPGTPWKKRKVLVTDAIEKLIIDNVATKKKFSNTTDEARVSSRRNAIEKDSENLWWQDMLSGGDKQLLAFNYIKEGKIRGLTIHHVANALLSTPHIDIFLEGPTRMVDNYVKEFRGVERVEGIINQVTGQPMTKPGESPTRDQDTGPFIINKENKVWDNRGQEWTERVIRIPLTAEHRTWWQAYYKSGRTRSTTAYREGPPVDLNKIQ